MNKEVNFEIAKLLEKKGFSEKTLQAYVYRGVEHQDSSYKGRLTKDKLLCDISAPTIAEVIMWLYEKHGIWVYTYKIKPFVYDDVPYPEYVWISKCDEKFIDSNNGLAVNHYYDPIEAYEAAIKYTLENLIQGGNK